jgi:hypothetical protein
MHKADIEHMIFFWLAEHDLFKISFDQYAGENQRRTRPTLIREFP